MLKTATAATHNMLSRFFFISGINCNFSEANSTQGTKNNSLELVDHIINSEDEEMDFMDESFLDTKRSEKKTKKKYSWCVDNSTSTAIKCSESSAVLHIPIMENTISTTVIKNPVTPNVQDTTNTIVAENSTYSSFSTLSLSDVIPSNLLRRGSTSDGPVTGK